MVEGKPELNIKGPTLLRPLERLTGIEGFAISLLSNLQPSYVAGERGATLGFDIISAAGGTESLRDRLRPFALGSQGGEIELPAAEKACSWRVRDLQQAEKK